MVAAVWAGVVVGSSSDGGNRIGNGDGSSSGISVGGTAGN